MAKQKDRKAKQHKEGAKYSPDLSIFLSRSTSLSLSYFIHCNPYFHSRTSHTIGHLRQATTETQLFRLIEKNAVEEIPCYQEDGQYFVYWEDVELVFPGIRHLKNGNIARIKNGNVAFTLMRDSNGKRYDHEAKKKRKDFVYFVSETMRKKLLNNHRLCFLESSLTASSIVQVQFWILS